MHAISVARIAQAQVAAARSDAPAVRAVSGVFPGVFRGLCPVAISMTTLPEPTRAHRGPVVDDVPSIIARLGAHRLGLPPPTC